MAAFFKKARREVAKNVADIVELLDSIADEHYVVDYPDMVSFRRMYSQYAKRQLENNEVVIYSFPTTRRL